LWWFNYSTLYTGPVQAICNILRSRNAAPQANFGGCPNSLFPGAGNSLFPRESGICWHYEASLVL